MSLIEVIVVCSFDSGRDSNDFMRLSQSISNNIQKITQNGKAIFFLISLLGFLIENFNVA